MSDKDGVEAINELTKSSSSSNDAAVKLIKAIAECIDVQSSNASRALGYGQGRQSYGWSHWLADNMPLTSEAYKERKKEIGHAASANEMRRRYRIAFASAISPSHGEIFATQINIGGIWFDSVKRAKYPEGTKSLDKWIAHKINIKLPAGNRRQLTSPQGVEEQLTFGSLAMELVDILNTRDIDENGNVLKFSEAEQCTAELLVDLIKERMVVNRWKKKTQKKLPSPQQVTAEFNDRRNVNQ